MSWYDTGMATSNNPGSPECTNQQACVQLQPDNCLRWTFAQNIFLYTFSSILHATKVIIKNALLVYIDNGT